MDEFLIIKQKLEIYVDGVLIQVERVKEDTDLLNNSSNEVKKWRYNVLRINDEKFLKNAINSAVEWLKEFNKYVEETQKLEEELSNKQEIRDLRNMSEHETEYFYGKGHYQGRYIDKNTNLSASDTGIKGNEYLIGGRLKLSYIEEKFNELKNILKSNKFNITIEGLMKL